MPDNNISRGKPKQKLADYPPCVVAGCNFPGLIEFRGEKFCLRHIRERIGGNARVSTHLDAVGCPTCKSTTETLQIGHS